MVFVRYPGAPRRPWSSFRPPGIVGKRGGVRVIYFNLTEQGTVVLTMLYAKTERANIAPSDIEREV